MPDKNLTDKEIVKALEDLVKCNNNEIDCGSCSLSKFYPCCPEEIGELSLDLINRLETENEENKTIIKVADKTIATLNAENESLKAEVERLTEENKKVSAYIGNGWGYVSFLEFVKNQRTEAYKEFAEKAKEFMHNKFKALDEYEFEYITERDIDNLIKEIIGE